MRQHGFCLVYFIIVHCCYLRSMRRGFLFIIFVLFIHSSLFLWPTTKTQWSSWWSLPWFMTLKWLQQHDKVEKKNGISASCFRPIFSFVICSNQLQHVKKRYGITRMDTYEWERENKNIKNETAHSKKKGKLVCFFLHVTHTHIQFLPLNKKKCLFLLFVGRFVFFVNNFW